MQEERTAGLAADRLRNAGYEVTSRRRRLLRGTDIRIRMLTGDSRSTAEVIARRLAIDDVQTEVLRAQDRSREVAKAHAARALAQADLGIPMGTGTDVAYGKRCCYVGQRRPPRNRTRSPVERKEICGTSVRICSSLCERRACCAISCGSTLSDVRGCC
jgi:hypothetical protein